MSESIAYPCPEVDELVRQLQACTPLCALGNMDARAIFELLLQRGWRIVRVKADDGTGANAA
jgi:hypothetical protein